MVFTSLVNPITAVTVMAVYRHMTDHDRACRSFTMIALSWRLCYNDREAIIHRFRGGGVDS